MLINLETAHPAKFLDVMKSVEIAVEIPPRLKSLENKEKHALSMENKFDF